MNMNLTENETLKYNVKIGDKVLLETFSKATAEQFISTLTGDAQSKAVIVPVTQDGLQVLLG